LGPRLINYHGIICSVNSVVQCLYGTRELPGLMRELEFDAADTPNAVPVALKNLFRDMSAESAESAWPCDPSRLVDSMSVYRGTSFWVQEDAEAVFGCIVNALADGCGPDRDIGKLWRVEKEDSVRCLSCNAVLSSGRSKSNTILVSLENRALPRELQEYVLRRGGSDYNVCECYCDTCRARTRVVITSHVLSLPPVVCVKIARIRLTAADRLAKIEKGFAFPETLDLKPLVKEIDDAGAGAGPLYHYELYAGLHVKTTYGSDGSDLSRPVAYMLMYQRK
uniref:USP domain-containing protein n=1 Tax=Monopterus albus TaxID=43700 RepID=A0A3Q3JJN6_MONAL